MIIFPAIDLSGGRVVRLSQGDYDRMTVYGDDPVETAKVFREKGAEALHVVDLDAAKDGGQPNFAVIEALAKVSGFLQVGGGGRDEVSVERYVSAGVNRVVIGSAAFERPGFLKQMAKEYPGKIAAGVDARDGIAMIRGWRVATDVNAFEFLKSLPDMGVDTAIFTDISKDGMMEGINAEAYGRAQFPGLRLIASGGVSKEEDILSLRAIGVYGAIIGRALYNGALTLERVLNI